MSLFPVSVGGATAVLDERQHGLLLAVLDHLCQGSASSVLCQVATRLMGELRSGQTYASVEQASNFNQVSFIRLYHPNVAAHETQLRFYLWIDKDSLCSVAFEEEPHVKLSIERSQDAGTIAATTVLFEELAH